MASTFGQVWRAAAGKHPGVPPLTVRSFAQNVWKALVDRRQWFWRRKQSGFRLEASRDLALVGVTANSPTVTSAALFLTTDLGRQFRVNGYPLYTIIEVTTTSTVVLDRPYLGDTNAAEDDAQILDAYATVPDDFQQFLLMIDPVQQVRIGTWYTQDQLGSIDPVRTNAGDGSPRGLFALDLSPLNDRPRYEVWPYTTSAIQLPYWYSTAAVDLADDDELPGAFKHRGDAVEMGVRIECARYPGTPAQKNPHFSLDLADRLEKDYAFLLRQMENRDDDQSPQDLVQYMTWPLASLAPTADYLRRTDWPAGVWGWGDGVY